MPPNSCVTLALFTKDFAGTSTPSLPNHNSACGLLFRALTKSPARRSSTRFFTCRRLNHRSCDKTDWDGILCILKRWPFKRPRNRQRHADWRTLPGPPINAKPSTVANAGKPFRTLKPTTVHVFTPSVNVSPYSASIRAPPDYKTPSIVCAPSKICLPSMSSNSVSLSHTLTAYQLFVFIVIVRPSRCDPSPWVTPTSCSPPLMVRSLSSRT